MSSDMVPASHLAGIGEVSRRCAVSSVKSLRFGVACKVWQTQRRGYVWRDTHALHLSQFACLTASVSPDTARAFDRSQ